MRKLLIILLGLVAASYSAGIASEIETKLTFNKFLYLLESDEYRPSLGLPDFNPSQIDTLLKLAENTKTLYNFPRNPLSSFFAYSCPMRAVCLWLVEGIRLYDKELGKEMKFASLNPTLIPSGERFYDNKSENLEKGLALYKKWWSPSARFDSLRKINPLEGSGLKWL